MGRGVQLLCHELRRHGAGLTQLAEARLQPRERRKVQLLDRSLSLLLCLRVLTPGCCGSLLRAPSTCSGAGCASAAASALAPAAASPAPARPLQLPLLLRKRLQ